jgi:hypothetical protein
VVSNGLLVNVVGVTGPLCTDVRVDVEKDWLFTPPATRSSVSSTSGHEFERDVSYMKGIR